MKTCIKCKRAKSLANFGIAKVRGKSYRRNKCKNCYKKEYKNYPSTKTATIRANKRYRASAKDREKWRYRFIKQKYNLTKEDYEELLKLQNFVCAICGRKEKSLANNGKIKPLCVDHDHATGKVRGLLCDKCNQGLGKFEDNLELFNEAIRYLTRP